MRRHTLEGGRRHASHSRPGVGAIALALLQTQLCFRARSSNPIPPKPLHGLLPVSS